MGIDDRLERLTERHEVLAQSMEMLQSSIREQGENIRQQSRNIDRVIVALEKDAETIRALVRIAEIREGRISHLEGGAVG